MGPDFVVCFLIFDLFSSEKYCFYDKTNGYFATCFGHNVYFTAVITPTNYVTMNDVT